MQEPLLFNDTIKENILYGNQEASDEKIKEVCEMANAIGFIEQSAEDLDNEDVQARIKTEYDVILKKLLTKNEELVKLMELISESLTIVQMRLINNMFSRLK